MKVGLVAPVFSRLPEEALSVAQSADEKGLDGVFSYDHLFPIRSPERPALAAIPMLTAMAVLTERVQLGTLVSRVTLLPLPVLVDALATLNEISGGRAIAGIGAGDSLTVPENQAYGMVFPSLEERLHLLAEAARALRARGLTTWVGGRSPRVRAIAAADADGWNSWDGPLDQLTAHHDRGGVATWGGFPPAEEDLAGHLRSLRQARVDWAIYGPAAGIDWPRFVAKLASAAEAVR